MRPMLPILRAALAAASAALWLVPAAARATSGFETEIPNGNVLICRTCHPMTNPPAYNAFGRDVQANLAGGRPSWAALWMLDSDQDGQTNGQELGDPCGVWRRGQVPGRTAEISAPGNSGATSLTPDEPPCGPPDAGVIDTGTPDADPPDAPVDAGAPPPDTGVVVPRADAGPEDAGPVRTPDSGVGTDGGGCRCVSPAGAASPWWLLAGGLILLRRRSR